MSSDDEAAFDLPESVGRLKRHDSALKGVYLTYKRYVDADLGELVDCLLARPDVVTHLGIAYNLITDETGVKLARYLAASTTVEWLNLSTNRLGEATYLAVAAALRVNTSLRILNLCDNQALDRTRVDAAFVDALRLNPHRPASSVWLLHSSAVCDADFERLKTAASQAHPALQALLLHSLAC